VAVAEDQRAVTALVIDVGVTVDVPLAPPFRPVDVDRMGKEIAGVVGDAAREQPQRFPVALRRTTAVLACRRR
jgi:hypothetical protein